MRKNIYLQKWYMLLIVVLLFIPLLHLYISKTTSPKINKIALEYEFSTASYSLSADIAQLILNGHAYMISGDETYYEKFNTHGVTVTRKELDLYHYAPKEEQKHELESLINLTRSYILFMQDQGALAKNTALDPSASAYLKQHDALAMQLQAATEQIQLTHRDNLQKQTQSIMAAEKIISLLSAILFVFFLTMLLIGTRKLIYPMLIRSGLSTNIITLTRSAVVIIDQRGKITKVNQAAEKLLEIPASTMVGRALNEVTALHPPLQTLTKLLYEVLLKQTSITNNQLVYLGGGQKTLVTVDYFPLYFMDKLTGAAMIAYFAEFSRDKQYLFDAIESERKKISIEIHDWIGRCMSPIIHALDYIMRSAEQKIPRSVYGDLVGLRGHCQTAVMDMRGIMNDIHPYLIDKVGLIPALESYTNYFEQMHNIGVYMFYQNRHLKVDKRAEIIVYRIIQEALTNVSKHSNATEVDIYFKETQNTLSIEVLDNGTGSEDFVAGTGLWGMKERANLIGGDLVYSSSEAGFSVTLTVPLVIEGENDSE